MLRSSVNHTSEEGSRRFQTSRMDFDFLRIGIVRKIASVARTSDEQSAGNVRQFRSPTAAGLTTCPTLPIHTTSFHGQKRSQIRAPEPSSFLPELAIVSSLFFDRFGKCIWSYYLFGFKLCGCAASCPRILHFVEFQRSEVRFAIAANIRRSPLH